MIVFAHLLNDRSGSPRVLCSTVAAIVSPADGSRLFVGSGGSGCLDEVGIETSRYWYRRGRARWATLFTYLFSQLLLFLKLVFDRRIDRNAVVYVNTLLPFGAALYGRLTGRRVVYHVHEISLSPAPLKWLLMGVARWASSLNIYVSDAHRLAMPIGGVPAVRVHNALDPEFLRRAAQSVYAHRRDGVFTVLMVASLRDYKGVPELLALAESIQDKDGVRFELLVNDGQEDIERYFAGRARPANLVVHPRTADPGGFYSRASLLLNLSRVDQWVETFGMTILEAMAFGVPVIVPPVGGPTELVTDGVEGYWVDSLDRQALLDCVARLSRDEALCLAMSKAGRNRAAAFSPERFAEEIRRVVLG
jgi:glycosyltransferase involved in cell wall biosynthesis